ncbi:MinD/ParA family protein [Bacillus sp. B1-b2]|uniref:MinD/ParA family protein n=1 Tax=Bacillus sp. B1-b2 TaxID=2653201 RepID=UPI00126182C6|nr:MinD/ParA family protein [Bacillus sp. B1-b2]KAB7668656.1 MinD/ParA family protein [Bacillus sp. B1-b2]
MTDQAAILREKILQLNKSKDKEIISHRNNRTLAIISGKGGVGKSNFSLNFALTLQKNGFKTLLLDMDIGMGNIDILLGKKSSYTIVDYFKNNISFKEIIMKGPEGLDYIAGGSGLTDFVEMKSKLALFFQHFQECLNNYDYILFDMGAGISEDSLQFILSVDDIIVLTTPEPTSITDAYAAMKFIHLRKSDIPFYLVVNRTMTDKDGFDTIQKIQQVVNRFLQRDLIHLGLIPDDPNVPQAVRSQIPFIFFNEKSEATKSLKKIADRYGKQQFTEPIMKEKNRFVSKLKRFLFER